MLFVVEPRVDLYSHPSPAIPGPISGYETTMVKEKYKILPFILFSLSILEAVVS